MDFNSRYSQQKELFLEKKLEPFLATEFRNPAYKLGTSAGPASDSKTRKNRNRKWTRAGKTINRKNGHSIFGSRVRELTEPTEDKSL